MPRIRIFGGFHYCPGSRRSLIERVTGETPPALIAVEWSRALVQSLSAARPEVEEAALRRWPFLNATDAQELSAALAWEAEVPTRLWSNVEVVWLEDKWQVDDLRDRHQMGCDEYAGLMARNLIERISDPSARTMRERLDDPPPAEPTSLKLLIDRLWQMTWEDVGNENHNNNLHRDERWLKLLEPRLAELRAGWVALVVGWMHADPSATGRLRERLTHGGFEVESVRLGP